MDELELILKGLVIGLVIAAPVGPIGFLCISRTLEYGPLVGLATGLGAAVADAVYGAIAAFGLLQVAAALAEHENLLRVGGGLALCAIGLRSLVTASRGRGASEEPHGSWERALEDGGVALGRKLTATFGSAFLLTLANPATILSFVAIFAALGWAKAAENDVDAGLLVAGVFVGSSLWWLGLSIATGLFRHRMGDGQRVWIQRASGVAIFGFGIFAMLSVLV